MSSLTARQQYVVAALGHSDSLGEAANTLGLHPSALSAKLRTIAHRLGLTDTAELVAMARRNQLLDAASEAIFGVDARGECVFANHTGASLFGYDPAELVGSDIHSLVHGTTIDGSVVPLEECPLHQAAIGEPGPHEAETVMWHRDGQPRWVRYRAETVGGVDERQIVVVTLKDVTETLRSEWQLALTESHLEMALEASGIAAFQVDLRTERITGWGNVLPLADGIPYEQFLAAVHPKDRHKVSLDVARELQPGSVIEDDIVLVTPSGEERPMRTRAKMVTDASGEPAVLLGAAIDMTAHHDAERMYQAFLDVTVDAFIRIDALGAVTEWNHAAETIFKYRKEQALGRPLEDLIIADRYRQDYRRTIEQAARSNSGEPRVHGPSETSAMRADGQEIPIEATYAVIPIGGGIMFQGILRDISRRKAVEARLLEHAFTDELTGLANRLLLQDRLRQALVKLSRSPGTIAVLFVDLDRFKVVNETIGHAAGDLLIQKTTKRIQAVMRPGDTGARFGSDQFVFICEGVDEHQALDIAEAVLAAVEVPVSLEGYNLRITASIGIALTDDPGADADHLVRDADAAMCRAKQNGRGGAEIFNPGMRERAVERLQLEAELRQALVAGELRVFYQPVVDTTSERMTAVEALVRWEHPKRGLLGPAEFMPIAEDTGLIVPLGTWVLRTACADLASWGPRADLNLAVNLSIRQLAQPDIIEVVTTALRHSGIAPQRLCLELTETALSEDTAAEIVVLQRLHEIGVTLAVDDFGTGHSSLLRLRQFPISILKLDQLFISGLGQNSDDTAIVKATIQLADALGITALAEGIERPNQLDILRNMGCLFGQGYLWSAPVPADQIAHFLVPGALATG